MPIALKPDSRRQRPTNDAAAALWESPAREVPFATMERKPARSTWNLTNICLLLASAIMAALIGSAVLWLSVRESRNRVYLLEDGNFAMGSPAEVPMTGREVAERFSKLEMLPGRVVVDVPPNRSMKDLFPFLEETLPLSLGRYQVRVKGTEFNFMLPFNGMRGPLTSPRILDLRTEKSERNDEPSDCDVRVLVNDNITVEDLVAGLRPILKTSESIEIWGDTIFLYPDSDRPVPDLPNPLCPPTTMGRILRGLKAMLHWRF